jgi:hypothetical protein
MSQFLNKLIEIIERVSKILNLQLRKIGIRVWRDLKILKLKILICINKREIKELRGMTESQFMSRHQKDRRYRKAKYKKQRL